MLSSSIASHCRENPSLERLQYNHIEAMTTAFCVRALRKHLYLRTAELVLQVSSLDEKALVFVADDHGVVYWKNESEDLPERYSMHDLEYPVMPHPFLYASHRIPIRIRFKVIDIISLGDRIVCVPLMVLKSNSA